MLDNLEEYSNIDLKDERLKKRFERSLKKLLESPNESIPSALGDFHQAKGLYRLLANPNVRLDEIQECQRSSTYERIERYKRNKVLLAIQDTSDINYSRHKTKKELGEIQNGILRGLKIHPTLVLTKDRIPLGVIHSKLWTSDPEKKNEKKKSRKEKAIERNKTRIEEKESYKWIESIEQSVKLAKTFKEKEVINISDRESDLYELFVEIRKSELKNLNYIIRSQHRRSSKAGKKLKEEVESQKVSGRISFSMKRGKKQRKVEQEISYKELILKPPKAKKGLGEVKMTVVLAKETQESAGSEKPIEWMLLTNKKIDSGREAIEILDYYLARWDIEIYFKILKSGCKIESLQLESKENLSKCLAMYMIVAWKIMYLVDP